MSVKTTKKETYLFAARDSAGRQRHGQIEASSRVQAIFKLDKSGLSGITVSSVPQAAIGEDETEKLFIQEASDPVKTKPYATIRPLSVTLEEYQSSYSYLQLVSDACALFGWLSLVVALIVAAYQTETADEFTIAAAARIFSGGILLIIAGAFLSGFSRLCASNDLSADLSIAAIHRLDDIEGRILELDNRPETPSE